MYTKKNKIVNIAPSRMSVLFRVVASSKEVASIQNDSEPLASAGSLEALQDHATQHMRPDHHRHQHRLVHHNQLCSIYIQQDHRRDAWFACRRSCLCSLCTHFGWLNWISLAPKIHPLARGHMYHEVHRLLLLCLAIATLHPDVNHYLDVYMCIHIAVSTSVYEYLCTYSALQISIYIHIFRLISLSLHMLKTRRYMYRCMCLVVARFATTSARL